MSAGSAVTARATNQSLGGGVIPTSALQPKQLLVELIPRSVARGIIVENHYLHRMGIATHSFGVFGPQRELVGAITFGPLASREAAASLGQGTPTLELTRLWLSDRCARNSESRVIRIAVRLLAALCPDLEWIATYADPSVGHDGTIYRAAGFVYVGLGPQRYDFVPSVFAERRFVRTRASVPQLKTKAGMAALGIPFKRVPRVRKHRYVLALRHRLTTPRGR
jgi:hypothetical protein